MSTQNPHFQLFADHAEATARLFLQAARENFEAGAELAQQSFAVRTLDDAKQLGEHATQAARAGFERTVALGQQTMGDTSALLKTQAETAGQRLGAGLPSIESLFDPKTYGFDANTFAFGQQAEAVKETVQKATKARR